MYISGPLRPVYMKSTKTGTDLSRLDEANYLMWRFSTFRELLACARRETRGWDRRFDRDRLPLGKTESLFEKRHYAGPCGDQTFRKW